MRLFLLVVLWQFCCFGNLGAQSEYDTLRWRYLTVEDGLLSNNVTAIHQDRLGFIWIGTKSGLSRYDSYGFESFSHLPSDSLSLSDNTVTAIEEDSEGQLWVGTQHGLNLLQENRSDFVQLLHDESDETSLSDNQICVLFEDREKTLWVGTEDGTLHRFNRASRSFTRFSHPGHTGLKDIVQDQNGKLVLGFGNGGVIFFDKYRGAFHEGQLSGLSAHLRVTSLLEDRKGTIWVGTWDGLHSFQPGSQQLTGFPAAPDKPGDLNLNIILDLHEQENGTIWIGTDGGGINVLHQPSGTFSYLTSVDDGRGLNSMAITRIERDRSGGLWVGTVNGGLNQLKRHQNQVDRYTYDNGNPTGLSGKSVISLYESRDGNLWIGLDHGGLNYFNRQTGRFTHFVPHRQQAGGITGNVVTSVFEDSQNDVYIGTYLSGFNVFDQHSEKFHHFKGDISPDCQIPSFVTCFFEDSFEEFWIGSNSDGLLRFDRKNKTTVRYLNDPGQTGTISDNIINCIYEDGTGDLWIGTNNGLNRYDRGNDNFRVWHHSTSDTNSLTNNMVIAIHEDEQGDLWIGTYEGLNRFDKKSSTFTRYLITGDHSWKTVQSILPGKNGNLWIATDRGIVRFSPSGLKVEPLHLGDNIIAQEFNRAAIKSSDGKLWFGSVNGIYSFYPDKIRKNPLAPPVVITKVLIPNAENIPLQSRIGETKELKLTHRESSAFIFEFVALDYTSSRQNQYAYQLEGFEDSWNTVGNQRNATYTNIDPGNYVFRVKASNNDGVWTAGSAAVKITIFPPWWKSWWAYTGYVTIFLLAVLGIRYSEKNRMKLLHELKLTQIEKEKAEEINQIKSRFFTNISHEFKTPLTLILGPVDNIIRSSGKRDGRITRQLHLIRQNANRLLGLIDQIMDLRKTEVGQLKLNAAQSDLIPLIKEVVDSFAERAKEKGIELNFKTSTDHLPMWLDAAKLDRVLFNLLSNAFEHTDPGGCISLAVKKVKRSYVEIAVKDTGCGIAPEDQEKVFERFYQVNTNGAGSGIGLSLAKNLVQLHHGKIMLESEAGKGSTFTVRLPLGCRHLKQEEKAGAAQVPQPRYKTTEMSYLHPAGDNSTILPAKSHSLLIVEDDTAIRAFLRDTLAPGYQITEAGNAEEGLQKAGSCSPDLIISDIMMPGMNGFEFCRQIKTNLNTSHIPVILLTARTGEESHLEGLDTGADDYLTKPFQPCLLEARIKNLIAGRQKLKDRFLSEFNLSAGEITITSVDEQFMLKAVEIVQQNLSEQKFTVETLVKEMGMSRSVFSKKMKALSGQSPGEFIRTIKLKRAALLLLKSGKSISEVAYELGFVTPKTFRTQFKKQYGHTPSEFISLHKPNDSLIL